MRRWMWWIAGLVLVGLAGWIGASWYSTYNLETADYQVVSKRSGYEVRLYAPALVAQTRVEGVGNAARGEAFRRIAGFIFGGNAGDASIAMTAPVTIDGAQSGDQNSAKKGAKIEMTAPVTIQQDGGAGAASGDGSSQDGEGQAITMRFFMPSKYTAATLPKPNDPRVEITTVPERRVAAIRFSWGASEARRSAKARELVTRLTADGLEPAGPAYYAGYNAPFTVPFMQRHEMLVPLAGGATGS
ncbi:MAG: heme-binding protein [Pseudomonadota bacterium]